MAQFPHSPHAIVQITQPGITSGQGKVVYDSWTEARLFESIDVELVTNQTSQAQVRFFDPKFRVIDAFYKATAKAVFTIYMGHGLQLGEPVFKGILGEVERGNQSTTFTVFDMAYKMKLEKKARYKNKRDDLQVMEELVTQKEYGLKFEGPEGNPLDLEPFKVQTQDQQTDWEWLMERANDSGLVIYVRQDTVFAKYPAKVGRPSLTIENGKDFQLLNEFDFVYKTPENQDGKPKVVKHRRRGKAGKRVEGESDTATDGTTDVVLKRDTQSPTKTKLTKRAQAQKDLQREHAYTGHIERLKNSGPLLDVRNTIEVVGIGKMFSGKYIADKVNYNFGPGRLELGMDLYRDAEPK